MHLLIVLLEMGSWFLLLSKKGVLMRYQFTSASLFYSISIFLEVLQLLSAPPEGAVSPRMAVQCWSLWMAVLPTGSTTQRRLQGLCAAGMLVTSSQNFNISCHQCDFSSQSQGEWMQNEDVVPTAGKSQYLKPQIQPTKPPTPFCWAYNFCRLYFLFSHLKKTSLAKS